MVKDWSFAKFFYIMENPNWLKQGWSKAIEYKNSCVPSRLYKYCPLRDKNYSCYRKRNKERLTSLQEKQLQVSNCKSLNDPFEFNALSLNCEKIREYGLNVDNVKYYFEFLKKRIQVCSFSNYGVSGMPLWAHYANNHKGYCIEYAITNKNSIWPITYLPKREAVATIPAKIYFELRKGMEGNKAPSRDFWKYFTYLYLTFSFKYDHWQYENEFRFFTAEHDVDKGLLIPLTEAKLDIEKIYIGIYCDYKKELIKIGKNIGCQVYKMIFDDSSLEFILQSERIL